MYFVLFKKKREFFMIEFSSIFAQYRSFDQIYLFKSDAKDSVTLEVYDLGLNRLRTRPITTASLSDIYHLPSWF